MSRLWQWWTAYWFRPQPVLDLAVCRVLWVGFQLVHLLAVVPKEMADLSHLPPELYKPIFTLQVLLRPLGGAAETPLAAVPAVYGLTVVAGVLALLGCMTNLSVGLFALGNIFLQALRYSHGELHHPEAAMMLGLALLALGPCGSVLSVDAWWRRRGSATVEPAATRTSVFAGWPLRAVQWVLAVIYLSSAYAKLADAGLAWMNGHTLQYYLIRDGLRWERDLGVWLGQSYLVAWILGWVTIIFEGTFVLAAIIPRLAWVYLPVGLMLHLGIYVTMKASFFTYMVLYAAFVPWAWCVGEVRRRIRVGTQEALV